MLINYIVFVEKQHKALLSLYKWYIRIGEIRLSIILCNIGNVKSLFRANILGNGFLKLIRVPFPIWMELNFCTYVYFLAFFLKSFFFCYCCISFVSTIKKKKFKNFKKLSIYVRRRNRFTYSLVRILTKLFIRKNFFISEIHKCIITHNSKVSSLLN